MGRWRQESAAVLALGGDILVLSEFRQRDLDRFEGSAAWCGRHNAKGLAIIGTNGWTIKPVACETDLHVLSAYATQGKKEVAVVGVWAMPDKGDYVTPMLRALAELPAHRRLIVAGDFNANPTFDAAKSEGRRFMTLVEHLRARGLSSIWHHNSKDAHGEEKSATFHWRLKRGAPYHIDYVFASNALVGSPHTVSIGSYEEWVHTKRSDHAPVIVDFDLGEDL